MEEAMGFIGIIAVLFLGILIGVPLFFSILVTIISYFVLLIFGVDEAIVLIISLVLGICSFIFFVNDIFANT